MDAARRASWIWLPTALLVAVQLWMAVVMLAPHRAVGMGRLGNEVTRVRPGLPVDRAGIKVGDRIELDDQARALFRAMALAQLEGPYHLKVHRGSSVFAATLVPGVYPGWRFYQPDTITVTFVAIGVFIIYIGLAAWLFTLRPTLMTFSFFFAAWSAGPAFDQFSLTQLPVEARFWVQLFYELLFNNAGAFMLIVFALRFPDDRAGGGRAIGQRIAIAAVIGMTLLGAVNLVSALSGNGWADGFLTAIAGWLDAIALAIALGVFIVRLRATEGASHARLRWALLGVAVPLVVSLGFTIAHRVYHGSFGYWGLIPTLAWVALPVTIAYVLTRTRFVDPRFTVNRAAVFSAMGTLLVLAVGAVDWLSSRLLVRRGATEIVDAAFAIAFGFGLNAVHRRVDRAVERFVFAAKHRAERRIREVGAALSYATAEGVVEDALVGVAARELRLASAALFRRRASGRYERVEAVGWPDQTLSTLDENDQIVRLLRVQRAPVYLREWTLRDDAVPSGTAEPRVAVPVLQRDEMGAVVFYGAHRDHTELDGSEIELLCHLAERASAALDHIEVLILRRALAATAASSRAPLVSAEPV